MPQVTVYIRKEDIESWKSVDKKSEFIHNALKGNKTLGMDKSVRVPIPRKLTSDIPLDITQMEDKPKSTASSLCSHWKVHGQCTIKSCPNYAFAS